MARNPPSKTSFDKKNDRSKGSSHTRSSHRASDFANSRRSGSMASAGPSEPQYVVQRGPLIEDIASSRASSRGAVHNNEPDDLQGEDTLNEVVMAVDLTPRGTVGCCYYVAKDEKLFFMEDIQLGDVDVVHALRLFIDPTVILVSTKIDDTVIDRFDPEGRSGHSASSDNDQFRLPFLLEVRPPSDFFYGAARNKLVNLHLGEENGTRVSFNVPGELDTNDNPNEASTTGQQGQLLRLAGWVDIESRVTVAVPSSNMYNVH
jgi:DNA mismatch repair protein MSH5